MTLPAWLKGPLEHLRSRGLFVLFVAALAVVARVTSPAPPPRTVEGVAAMLGKAAGGEVAPDGFLWEERGGFLKEALFGRRVLFLAASPSAPGAAPTADLYRARVRLTRAGRPISLHGLRNLTGTPLGDERELVGRGRFVAFATAAYGGIQGVTILDLAGDEADREARSRLERLQAAVEGWLDTGTQKGLGRTEIAFGSAPAEVKLEVAEDALVMALGPEGVPAALDVRTGELNPGERDPFLARAQRIPHPVRPAAPVAVELARRAAGEGSARALKAAIAWLGGGLPRDAVARSGGRGDASAPDKPPAAAEPTPSVDGWPPEPITPPVSPAMAGEGVWVAVRSPLLAELKPLVEPPSSAGVAAPSPDAAAPPPDAAAPSPDAAAPPLDAAAPSPDAAAPPPDAGAAEDPIADAGDPDGSAAPAPVARAPEPAPEPLPPPAPALFETIIRPDPSLPRASVRLVAMDMRQLELRVEAGFDEPRPVTGPRGSGRLPAGALAPRVVAAFAGGKPQGASELGMVVERRILVPPTPGAATAAVMRDGHIALGAWPFGAMVPESVTSLRQSPLLLVDGGSPASLDARVGGAAAERAALCATRGGHLIYAWSAEASAGALAKALALAGCEAAMHLGASPSRAGFAVVRSRSSGEGDAEGWDAELLTPAMSARPEQLTSMSPVELFYLVRRDVRPATPLPEGAAWALGAGRNPPPPWLPAVFTATTANLGAEVRLSYFAPERFVFRVRAGTRERSHRKGGTFLGTLDPAEQERAAAAIGLGAARRKGGPTRGLAIAGSVGLPIRKDAGLLVTTERGIQILRSEDAPEVITGDAVELPLTADEGKLLPDGRKVGSLRARAAACVLEGGALVVATATFDSDEATTEVLLNAGCARVVALDRGSQHPAFIHRAGTATPPAARYEASALYAVEIPMRGRAGPFPAAPSPEREQGP